LSSRKLDRDILNLKNLERAWAAILDGGHGKAPGIDRVHPWDAYRLFHKKRGRIIAALRRGAYEPSPLRAVHIPKANGKVRKLAIPTAQDRAVLKAAEQSIRKQVDPHFAKTSHGFRPLRSPLTATATAMKHLQHGMTHTATVDIQGFFDNVPQDAMLDTLERVTGHGKVYTLIRKHLEAGTAEPDGTTTSRNGTGIPQGSPISPLLANVYLHPLDIELERRGVAHVRFADDITVFTRSARAAKRAIARLGTILRTMGLEPSVEKTVMHPVGEATMLGFRVTAERRHIPEGAAEKKAAQIKEAADDGHLQEERTRTAREWLNHYKAGDVPAEELAAATQVLMTACETVGTDETRPKGPNVSPIPDETDGYCWNPEPDDQMDETMSRERMPRRRSGRLIEKDGQETGRLDLETAGDLSRIVAQTAGPETFSGPASFPHPKSKDEYNGDVSTPNRRRIRLRQDEYARGTAR
jgi:group II intron reverse transcriptase/maturase